MSIDWLQTPVKNSLGLRLGLVPFAKEELKLNGIYEYYKGNSAHRSTRNIGIIQIRRSYRQEQDGRGQRVGRREAQEPDGPPEPVLDLVEKVVLGERLVEAQVSKHVGVASAWKSPVRA